MLGFCDNSATKKTAFAVFFSGKRRTENGKFSVLRFPFSVQINSLIIEVCGISLSGTGVK